MRIAIIGGGAAGMTAAWLVDPYHEVVVYERESSLGGHIRTLGSNVREDWEGPPVDTGVIELEERWFPTVMALLRALDVPLEKVPGTTTMFARDGSRWLSPGALADEDPPVSSVPVHAWHALRMGRHVRGFDERTRSLDFRDLRDKRLGDFLGDSPMDQWGELLALYAYSTPRAFTRDLPAALAVPTLRRFTRPYQWYRVVGGTYAWIQRIVDQLRGEVVLDAKVEAVRRCQGGVEIDAGRGVETFDHVLFACPPHCVLPMLKDPTERERRWFGPWKGLDVQTVVHTDRDIYDRRGARSATEFDVFDLGPDRGAYNAWLNRLCGLSTRLGPWYGLAFGLEDELDLADVLHIQHHEVPHYTVDAYRWRNEILYSNGRAGTWFIGAWLGDGLHEGAVSTAAAAAARLQGGRITPEGLLPPTRFPSLAVTGPMWAKEAS